jgi:hypothetical protein
MMPVHKSKAITYITPAARAEAVRQQNLVIRGKGPLLRNQRNGDRKLEENRRLPLTGPIFAVPSGVPYDKEQSEKNKALGYW